MSTHITSGVNIVHLSGCPQQVKGRQSYLHSRCQRGYQHYDTGQGGESAGEGGGIIGLSSAGCKEILFIKREVILLSKGCGLDEAWILRHI